MTKISDTLQQKSNISTNWAVNHLNGKLTDQMLEKMIDDQLRVIAFPEKDMIGGELYLAPENSSLSFNGHHSEDQYNGVHRAVLLLEQRKKDRIENAIERKQEDRQSFDVLVGEVNLDEIPF